MENSTKPKYHLVSFSGGKDSTAMLLGMIERGMKIDCILFCDTGLEFPAMYEHIRKVEQDIGRKITVVKSKENFEYLMFDKPVKRKPDCKLIKLYGNQVKGYGWAGSRMRWCTSKLKDMPREQFLRPIRKDYDIIEYVGIAADEGYRLERERNQQNNHRHPLVEWGMTEADCLKYCYDMGYDWDGLYQHFSRVSCWCCPLQPLTELRELFFNFPDLWQKLKEWDKRTWRKFRADYSVDELEVRFLLEQELAKSGISPRSKVFQEILKQRLGSLEKT